MYTSDKRILHLITYLIFTKTISSTSEFCRSVNIQKQNIPKIKNGVMHFTVKNIESICKVYNVNANWIFGIDKKVFNIAKSIEIDI